MLRSQNVISLLEAIAQTFVRRLEEDEEKEAEHEYVNSVNANVQIDMHDRKKLWRFNASDVDNIGLQMLQYFEIASNKHQLTKLSLALNFLSTPLGTYMLCGRRTRLASFVNLSNEERESALIGLSNSSLESIRQLYKAIRNNAILVCYGNPIAHKDHPGWNGTGYPGTAYGLRSGMRPKEFTWSPKFIDVSLLSKNLEKSQVELVFDVVVVGSGAGGGLMGKIELISLRIIESGVQSIAG